MSEKADLSASMQDYLEAVLELEQKDSSVRITDIANKLNIAKASVNQTINKLKELGFVRQQVYGPVMLTDSGRQMANKVRERHKTLSKFLIEALGVDRKIAEKDACLMEHVVSPETMEKLTGFLLMNGYVTDPANSLGHLNEASSDCRLIKPEETSGILALSELKAGEKGKVLKVASKGIVRKRIIEMGITAGTEVVVKGFAPLGDPMELGVKGYNLSLRKAEASNIFVHKI